MACDETAIQQLINRYVQCANAWDHAGVAETFAPDGVWHLTSLDKVMNGRDEIIATASKVSEKFSLMVLMNTPALIEVDGDRATAVSTVRESARLRDGGGSIEILGRYEDLVERRAEGWVFAKRKFTMLSMQKVEASDVTLPSV